jgi:Family of unknown function (DUF6364)
MAKLTLSVDEEVINDAKAYALEHWLSVSFLVEQYFKALTAEKRSQKLLEYERAIPDEYRSILWIVKDDGTDWEKEYKEHLLRKYT